MKIKVAIPIMVTSITGAIIVTVLIRRVKWITVTSIKIISVMAPTIITGALKLVIIVTVVTVCPHWCVSEEVVSWATRSLAQSSATGSERQPDGFRQQQQEELEDQHLPVPAHPSRWGLCQHHATGTNFRCLSLYFQLETNRSNNHKTHLPTTWRFTLNV